MDPPPKPPKTYVPGPISEDDLPDRLFEDGLEELADTQPQKPKARKVRVKSVERPEPAIPKLTNKAKKEARLKAAQENPLEAPEPKPAKPKSVKPPGDKKPPKTKKSKGRDAEAIKAQCDEVVHVHLTDPIVFWREQHSLFAHTDISNMISARLDFADWLALRRTCRAAYLRTSYTKLLKRRTTYLEDKRLNPTVMAKLLKLTLYSNYLVTVLEKKPPAPGKADLSFLGCPVDNNLRRAVFEKTHSINAYKATIVRMTKEIASFANVEMVAKMSAEFYNDPKFIRGCFGIDVLQNDEPTEFNNFGPTQVNADVLLWIVGRNIENFDGKAQSNLMFILDMAISHRKWNFLERIDFEKLPHAIVDSWFNNVLSYSSAKDGDQLVERLTRLTLPKHLKVRKYLSSISDFVMPSLGYKPFEDEFWVREEHSP